MWHWDEEGKDGYDRDFERWVLNGITTYSTGSGFLVCRPCSWWLHPLQAGRWKDRPDIVGDRGLRDADFVVRFEHMEEDLTTLSQLLDRPMPDLSRPVGQSVRRPYQEYHTPATRAWVEEYYHEDISLYGYQF